MRYRDCHPFFVEDDDDFALLLKRALSKAGVPNGNICHYRDGEGALADLVSMKVIRPSALLLDIELPGITGLCVLERIRACERFGNLPVFILSGRDDHSCVTRAYALGARGYWTKPHDNGTLQEIVTGILGSLERPERTPVPGSLLIGRS
jgi:DNA-binding response OmpR family regulator